MQIHRDRSAINACVNFCLLLGSLIMQKLACILLAFSLASCSSYITPGRQADLSTFTDPGVKRAFVAKPTIKFPANIALVRVQEGGYRSESSTGQGQGAYSVVTTRDIEKEADIDTLSNLPGLENVVTLNRLLLPKNLSSDLDLREAAAKLQADAILLYTLSTDFRDDDLIPPLTVLSLSILSTSKYHIQSTASAILMDTKTGYIYGALEEGSDKQGFGFIFDGSDAARKKAERAAFDKLLAAFEPFWRRIYSKHH
jgi:hypothetical protein